MAEIDVLIRQWKKSLTHDHFVYEQRRHEFARTKSQMKKWKSHLAQERLKKLARFRRRRRRENKS